MSATYSKASLIRSGLAATVLLVAATASYAQTVVNLTAAPSTAALPDGQAVPMWGYSCGTGNAAGTCAAANPNAGASWSPVVITVPYTGTSTSLTINLTNNLIFASGNRVPTSLVIVGQVGGGLGGAPTTTLSPVHGPQGPTWPASDGPDSSITDCHAAGAAVAAAAAGTNCPPEQPPRVQSFATEVATTGATLATGQVASGTGLVWNNLRPGTYLIESGTHPSIQGPMGLYGVVVVTQAPGTSAGAAYFAANGTTPTVNYQTELPLVLSEIDPVQNAAVTAAVNTSGFSETRPWSGQPDQCGNPASANYNTCYPPAVDYSPRYYLINGVSYDQTAPGRSQFATAPTSAGTVLVRIVNAGLRMHVPSIVGAHTGTANTPGMALIAEDGNVLPGVPKIQSEVFMAAGKTYDLLVNDFGTTPLPIFDRALALSTNSRRGGGMMATIARAVGANTAIAATATGENFFCVAGTPLVVSDPAKGVLANDAGANGAALTNPLAPLANPGTLEFNSNGTFTYTPPSSGSCANSFSYSVNGSATATAKIQECDQYGNGNGANCTLAVGPTAHPITFTSNWSTRFAAPPPGVLAGVTNPLGGLPLKAKADLVAGVSEDGSLLATPASGSSVSCAASLPAGTVCRVIQYTAVNAQGSSSSSTATVNFLPGSGLVVNVRDAKHPERAITDYRWIIEEDRTFFEDPKCQLNGAGRPANCPPLEDLGYNFHTSHMPIVATGCLGAVSCESGQTKLATSTVCDVGNGICRDPAAGTAGKTPVDPSTVYLDPTKRYYISVLPGDGENPTVQGSGGPMPDPTAADPDHQRLFSIDKDCPSASDFAPGTGQCGHAMGGAQLSGTRLAGAAALGVSKSVNIFLEETPLATAKIAAFVFEDDNPLNGEDDAGGAPSAAPPGLAVNEPGLGEFNLEIYDQAGGLGDPTGQITYDMFNQPVGNSLAGTIDPFTGNNACPITVRDGNIVGMIPTCPDFESDGVTQSALRGQAIISNLYPGLYEIVARPGADRIARGEEWIQTNTLDGTPPHEVFIKSDEPAYFQEFGPGNFHVVIGFANPKLINERRHNAAGTGFCDAVATGGGGVTCNANLFGQVSNARMSRTPDQRIFDSGDYAAYSFSQCYAAISAPDDADFAFAKCDADGKFEFHNLPANLVGPAQLGDFKITIFDQWNDIMLDGLVLPVHISQNGTGPGTTADTRINFPVTQWRTDIYTRTFLDTGDGNPGTAGDGVSQDNEPGLPLVATNLRYRDGSFGFFNNTDLNGYAGFNEVFPFVNWLVLETDTTRFKQTGEHVIYDAGGPADGSPSCTAGTPCGTSEAAAGLANTYEHVSLPVPLRVPGGRYCADADCPVGDSVGAPGAGVTISAGRVDPPQPWGATEAWQGLLGQSSFVEFGMKPFGPGENGGIKGHVIYASTRPFDDPTLLLQLSWEPGVPHVTINLYREDTAADGTTTLTLADTTTTSSWDDWAQGFRHDANGNPMTAQNVPAASFDPVTGLPTVDGAASGYIANMNCPGQDPTSPFYRTLISSPQWLDPASPKQPIAGNAQFKCYDGWSMLNQVQPAPYDGMYSFPSITASDPVTGKPTKSNCKVCTTNPDSTDAFRFGTPMLPAGKYVVEVVVPPGMELVKEEDKNILLGDVYVAPVATQFAGFGNIFIMPDQAAVGATYNANNTLNMTQDLGSKTFPRHEGDTGSIEAFWPCVGAKRIVPDYNSLFPDAGQNSPFAGALRPLCDRKEVTLEEGASVLAKFYVFTSTHIAGHMTGLMTNDFASEFDPFSPQFGEKFSPPDLPVGVRDFTGKEVGRVWGDQWGAYDGLNFSTYSVNPPNPTGYVPQMMILCMNDPGPTARTNANGLYVSGATDTVVATAEDADQITDPSYNSAYSNFCYENPFMPGFTTYLDTPVIPTQAFADSYNLPDAEYPDTTPAIKSVTGDAIGSSGSGPWLSAGGTGHVLTITALGTKEVQNAAYSGPVSTADPYNKKTITRTYTFGATPGTVALVGSDGVAHPLTSVTWGDLTIKGTVAANDLPPLCRDSNASYRSGTPNANARCGELVITAANGKRSIDTVMVTIGGSTPKYVSPASASTTVFGATMPNPLQKAIDDAAPGDLIIVGPGTYKENVLMWKPVRLQGVGAASVTINADAHPSDKLNPWRRQVNCLFGLRLDGVPNDPAGGVHSVTAFDPDGVYTCPKTMYLRDDRIPFEAIVGWDATGNGNLAQLLQEPTLMGAYEGAGITVLGRGVRIPNANQPGGTDFWGLQGGAVAGAYPDGSRWLNNNSDCNSGANPAAGRDYSTSNFLCNPSRIDGVSIINSSQGGGAIFMHGWNHYLEVSNIRVSANIGTLSGGINLGNGETPPLYTNDQTICGNGVPQPRPLCPPIPNNTPVNGDIPFQINTHVHVHHNMIINNASDGDALFSGTPSGAGGLTISAGADDYQIDHNWIAGNLSSGDGGGMVHSGLSYRGKINNNWILFNQSTNPTLPTNGGGLGVIGASGTRTLPDGTECGTVTDFDCPPGVGDGTGPGLVIDSNLILGNSAESGSGGGLRIQQVNGTEVGAFPRNPDRWFDVKVQNNIIANNVAGWDGAGVSLEDALKVTVINNTIVDNDTTASAGVLFKTLGAIDASSPPPGCAPVTDPTQPQNLACLDHNAAHNQQAAGLVTMRNTPIFIADAMSGTVTCPSGFGYTGGTGPGNLNNANCKVLSKPALTNDLFWHNRDFFVSLAGPGAGLQSQQNLVALVPQLDQTFTGECRNSGLPASGTGTVNTAYWDVGVRGDVSPNDGLGAGTAVNPVRLTLNNSILSPGVTYPGNNNRYPVASPVNAPYCNGSRVPPENNGHGYLAPPGRSETTGLSTVFVFDNITPSATVDEGNNWINLTYGPLTLTAPSASANNVAFTLHNQALLVPGGMTNAAYSIGTGSTTDAINHGTNSGAPNTDFFGATRSDGTVDIGAVEFSAPVIRSASVSPTTLAFGSQMLTTTSTAQTVTVTNTGTVALAGGSFTLSSAQFARATGGAAGNCGATLAVGANCTYGIVFRPTATGAVSESLTVAYTGTTVTGSPVTLTGTGIPFVAAPAATFLPTNWAPTQRRNCPGTGLGQIACALDPAQAFTLTNTGNVALTIVAPTVTGANTADYMLVGTLGGLGTTCGSTVTSLAVGATCQVVVQFKPLTSEAAGTKTVTVNQNAGLAGVKTATITGTAQ